MTAAENFLQPTKPLLKPALLTGFTCVSGRQRLRRGREDGDHLCDHPRPPARPPDRRGAHPRQLDLRPAASGRLGDGRLRHLQLRGRVQVPRKGDFLGGRRRVRRRLFLGVGQQQCQGT